MRPLSTFLLFLLCTCWPFAQSQAVEFSTAPPVPQSRIGSPLRVALAPAHGTKPTKAYTSTKYYASESDFWTRFSSLELITLLGSDAALSRSADTRRNWGKLSLQLLPPMDGIGLELKLILNFQ
jgi:hypothetical protein